jgi:hypothetical protein
VVSPAFPVIIIALVPTRLFLMEKIWNREVLRHVDQWACKDWTPEGDENARAEKRARRMRDKGEKGAAQGDLGARVV